MFIEQISVFLENKSGRLAEVTKILGDTEINISAISIADTTDFGILRLIVNRPEKAVEALGENGFTVSRTRVLAVAVPDKPGALARALQALAEVAISVEYIYAFVEKTTEEAVVILRVEELEKAVEVLNGRGIKVLPSSVVYEL